mmetsp:Transcript_22932/g.71115  ORF Transcript_22932/g.71115 Transcript_22932/m.71115 type:complete len:214 (+) Transcript_22932:61-702(+)
MACAAKNAGRRGRSATAKELLPEQSAPLSSSLAESNLARAMHSSAALRAAVEIESSTIAMADSAKATVAMSASSAKSFAFRAGDGATRGPAVAETADPARGNAVMLVAAARDARLSGSSGGSNTRTTSRYSPWRNASWSASYAAAMSSARRAVWQLGACSGCRFVAASHMTSYRWTLLALPFSTASSRKRTTKPPPSLPSRSRVPRPHITRAP